MTYQVLAVLLTYASIAFSWVPFLAEHASGSVGILDVVLRTPSILTLPIVIGIERPFSLVILGIGLWEAWKFTAPVPLAISGPFAAPAAAAPSPPPVIPPPAIPPPVP